MRVVFLWMVKYTKWLLPAFTVCILCLAWLIVPHPHNVSQPLVNVFLVGCYRVLGWLVLLSGAIFMVLQLPYKWQEMKLAELEKRADRLFEQGDVQSACVLYEQCIETNGKLLDCLLFWLKDHDKYNKSRLYCMGKAAAAYRRLDRIAEAEWWEMKARQ